MKTLTAFLFATAVFAQTAVVVPLSRADADAARESYAKYEKAKAGWETLQANLTAKYTRVDHKDKSAGSTVTIDGSGLHVRSGFECGIEFSADFSYAVPKACPSIRSPWGTIQNMPAFGGLSW